MTLTGLRNARATLAALTAAHLALGNRGSPLASLHVMLALLVLKIATDAADERLQGSTAHDRYDPRSLRGVRSLRVPAPAHFGRLVRTPGRGLAERAGDALRALVDANPQELVNTLRLEALRTVAPTDLEMELLLGRLDIPALDFRAQHGLHRPDLSEAVDALFAGVAGRRLRGNVAQASACLSELMVALLDPAPGEHIYDPLCHQGELLTAAAHWVRAEHDTHPARLLGEDPLVDHIRTARLRLLLQGENPCDLSARNALEIVAGAGTVREDDPRRSPVDVALCRPPPALTWRNEGAGADACDRFHLGVPARRRAHFALIQHMLSRLDERHGRLAIVVPQGVLFRQGEEAGIRTALLEAHAVETVIALPDRLVPGSSVASALLVLRRSRGDTSVLFIDARALSTSTPSRCKLDHSGVRRILELCAERKTVPEVSARVTSHAVIAAESCLSVARHLASDCDTAAASDLASFKSERHGITEELQRIQHTLDAEIDALIRELGDGNKADCDMT